MKRRRMWLMVALVGAGVALLFASVGIYAATTVPDVIKMNDKAYTKHKEGIVIFQHKLHAEVYPKKYPDLYKNGCGECHHDKDGKPLKNLKPTDKVQRCIECHKIPGERPKGHGAKKLTKEERLKYHAEAMHQACKGCHRKYNKEYKPPKDKRAPTSCKKCHPKK